MPKNLEHHNPRLSIYYFADISLEPTKFWKFHFDTSRIKNIEEYFTAMQHSLNSELQGIRQSIAQCLGGDKHLTLLPSIDVELLLSNEDFQSMNPVYNMKDEKHKKDFQTQLDIMKSEILHQYAHFLRECLYEINKEISNIILCIEDCEKNINKAYPFWISEVDPNDDRN